VLSSTLAEEHQPGSTLRRVAGALAPSAIGLGAAALWLLPSTGQLDKYLGAQGAIAVAVFALISLPLGFQLLAQRPAIEDKLAGRLTLLIVLALLVSFAVLYPLVLAHVVGGNSDREDALNKWLWALQQGRFPYFERTFQGTRLSPMPGAAFLALPAYVIGRSGLQNLFWLPAFVYYARNFFIVRETQVLFAGIFLLACPGAMQDFVTGGDYLVNCLYVLIAVDLVGSVYRRTSTGWLQRLGVCLFFSFCISSRQNYALAVPVLAAFILQHGGARRMVEFLGLTALFCAAINLPFYLYSPADFPLFHQISKFDFIPPGVHAPVVFPTLAAALAIGSFALRMTRARVYGMIAMSFVPLFLLPPAFWLWRFGPLQWIFIETAYCLPVTIFAGVWLLTKWRAPVVPAKEERAAIGRGIAVLQAAE
jgi:hypothetical protein